jgi:hypothetical protein
MCFTYHNMDANIVSHNMDVVRPENEPMLAKAKAEEQAEGNCSDEPLLYSPFLQV